MAFKLPHKVIKMIETKISTLFDTVKGKLLGQRGLDKTLLFVYNKDLSLPAMYEAASREEGGIPSIDTLDTLVDTSKKYIDALKLNTINKVVKNLESHLNDEKEITPETIEASLQSTWKGVTSQVSRVVDSEVQATKNIGLSEGILRSNAALGIEDPVVAFITANDSEVCDECTRLHLMPDGITPRLWYLSEVSRGYHKKGDPTPSIHELHPNGRCTMITVLPGYGFGADGRIVYIKNNHSEIKKQRS
jgi:hypothetical protein